MHHKYVVRDAASVWSGSTNWTADSWTREENVIVTVDSPGLAALGIGAVIGAWANYGLVKSLGKTAINAYRLRVLEGRILEEERTLEDK